MFLRNLQSKKSSTSVKNIYNKKILTLTPLTAPPPPPPPPLVELLLEALMLKLLFVGAPFFPLSKILAFFVTVSDFD